MTENRQRVEYLDFLRVFATVMVFIIHCTYEYMWDFSNKGEALWVFLVYLTELLRTGVPIFFMISGYLLLQKDITDIKGFYKKRFLKIAVPFIIYDIFYYILNCMIYGSEITISRFFAELADKGSAYHLWFVYSILFIYLLMPFLRMMVSKCSQKALWLLLFLVCFQSTIRPFLNISLNGALHFYLTDDGFMGYIGYVILGYIMGTSKFSKKTVWLIYSLGLVSFALFPIWNINTISSTGDFFFNGGYTINHYIEAAAVFLFFRTYFNKESRFVSKLSAVSFSAYLIHVAVLQMIQLFELNFSDGITMLIWTVAVALISFLWGFLEKAVTGAKF